ncbi:hypothetical protein PINS_up003609 [Pythium insidiosum]|nr:hypothetical protein PINS_up003609 [Pythium insidiosum]
MSHKAEALAYDREKRVYKDAYVQNFRRVRYFPALATIGAGRSDGDSIILVQESIATDAETTPRACHQDNSPSVSERDAPFDASRRLCPPDSVSCGAPYDPVQPVGTSAELCAAGRDL